MRRVAWVAIAASGMLVSSVAREARATGPALDCPSSSEEGQRLRDKNKYLEARAMFRACSQSTCPAIVRKDCSKWLAEIDDSQPSIVIAAQDATGADLSAVRVMLDDKQVASRIDGSPIAIDPGEHSLRVETEGHAPLSQRVIVRVNEKNRLIRVVFQDGPKPAVSGPPKPPAGDAPTNGAGSGAGAGPRASSGLPVLGFVVGGLGVLAMGSFAYFGLTSKSDLGALRSECAPFCDQSKLDDVKSRMLIADVSLGVGIVALGVAVVIFATSGGGKKPAVTASAGR
jgi:hypothetical protein